MKPGRSQDEGAGELRRELGLLDAAAFYVGTILGSGIFVAPSAVAGAAPSAVAALALWILGGVVAACGAACYAECAARLPRTGGFYIFYREAYGEPLAFLGGWAALLITYPASIAAIALIFARYLGEVAPALAEETVAPAAGVILVAGLLSVLGVRTGVWAQRLLTGAKVAALGTLCLAAILSPAAPRAPAASGAPEAAPLGLAALLAAMVVVLWTYDGWSDITLVAGEVRDPGRNIGRAVMLGTSVLVVLYAICQLSVAVLLSAPRAAASQRVLAEAVQQGLGAGSGRAVALLVVVCTFGSINAVVFTVSRLGFAMARDGVFPRWFGQVHPRWGSPARSVGAVVAAALAYVFIGGFANLLAFFSFSVWIFYALTAVALLLLRSRGVGEPVAWRAPGGAAAPAVVLATAAVMTSGLMGQDPRRSLTGLALLAAGIPAYLIWRRVRGLLGGGGPSRS